jgi:hypothetical protein
MADLPVPGTIQAFNPFPIFPSFEGEQATIGFVTTALGQALLVWDMAGGGGGGGTTPAVYTTHTPSQVSVGVVATLVVPAAVGPVVSRRITIRNIGDNTGAVVFLGASAAVGTPLDPGGSAGRAGDSIVLNTMDAVTMIAVGAAQTVSVIVEEA